MLSGSNAFLSVGGRDVNLQQVDEITCLFFLNLSVHVVNLYTFKEKIVCMSKAPRKAAMTFDSKQGGSRFESQTKDGLSCIMCWAVFQYSIFFFFFKCPKLAAFGVITVTRLTTASEGLC